MSKLIQAHQPCPDCDSSDALAIYDDGTFCFACRVPTGNVNIKEGNNEGNKLTGTADIGEYLSLPITGIINRGLNKDACTKFGVRTEVDQVHGVPARYFYPYYKDGELVAFKVRHAEEKVFYAVGTMSSDVELFGQGLAGEGGKMVIVTEGENDALAAVQMLASAGKNYRVVSLPNGANTNAIKANLEWLESFDTVVLNFDSDDAGVKVTAQACDLFAPGKVKVMQLP